MNSTERMHLTTSLRQVIALERRPDLDLDSALRTINKTAVVGVPGAMYAGVTVVDQAGQPVTVGATHPELTVLDTVHPRGDDAPHVPMAWTQPVVLVDDLSTETRWPTYRHLALKYTPYRAVLSFRLFDGEDTRRAALSFYADTPGAFTDQSLELGPIYAAHIALAWNLTRRDEQFTTALASRDLIGRAKGILMERFHLDDAAAFALLRKLSQDTNTKLDDVAGELTTTGDTNARLGR